MVFAYYVVFPLVFGFFTRTAPEGVAVMTDIGKYLDFVILLFLAFGVAFEVPIVTLVLVRMGLTTVESLSKQRPYIIVGAFVVGMLLTPPDVVSQVMLAVPMCLLFELGLWLSKRMPTSVKVKSEPSEQASESKQAYQPLSDEEMEAELDAIEGTEVDKTTKENPERKA
jgi:sec-independent protein translocase protein TatC